jgi:hypothetical protein
MRRVAAIVTAGWFVLGVALTAGVASAHRLGAGAFAVPIPLPMLYAGAGVTVAATAGWLGWGDASRVPTAPWSFARLPRARAESARTVARVGFLAAFLLVLGHGLVGPSTPAENLATVVVWPLVLKGVALVAVLAGSPWSTISPWRTLYDLLVAVEGEEIAVLGGYPDRLGSWPALVGFVLGVGVLENLTVATRSPTATVAVAGGYAAVMLLGGVAFGREWFARADALAVLFALLGRVAVLRVEWGGVDGWNRDGPGATAENRDGSGVDVTLRPPWTGCLDAVRDRSVVVFAVTAVYTVSFDGFTATATFRDLRFAAVDAVGLGVAGASIYLAGLVIFVASYLGAARLSTLAARWATDATLGTARAARAFAGPVVPIAAAYEVAHNYPFVLANAAQVVVIARDVLLGVGGSVSVLGWLPVPVFWASQVTLVVAGHIVGVVTAHGVATRLTRGSAGARRVHAPFVVVMVGYTVLSLWVISQPLAT